MKIWSLILAAFLLIPNAPVRAQDAEADWEAVTTMLYPEAGLINVINDACEVRRRTVLLDTPSVVEIDEQIPGLIEHMVSITRDYCVEHTPEIVANSRATIRSQWSSRVTSEENSRLADLFREEIAMLETARVRIGSERDLEQAVDVSAFDVSDRERRDFDRKVAEFSSTPGGSELLQRLGAFQTELQLRQDELMAPIAAMIQQAMAASRASANDYVSARGYDPIYQD